MASPTLHTLKITKESLKKVTVFNDRAELKREFTVELSAGLNEVVIEAISQHTNDDSVRVTGRGTAVIEEVQVAKRRIARGAMDSERAAEIRKEKEELEAARDQVGCEGEIVQKQSAALDAMVAKIGAASKDDKFSVDTAYLNNVTSLFAFHRKEVAQLREEFRKLKKEDVRLLALIAAKTQELNAVEKGDVCKNVVVLLEAEEAGTVTLEVTYQVAKAGWSPVYDIRVDTNDGKTDMQLSYYANVNQSTGEEWEGALLTLSTARPSVGGCLPDLQTLDVSLRSPSLFGTKTSTTTTATVLFGSSRPSGAGLFGAPAAGSFGASNIPAFGAVEEAPPPQISDRQAAVAEQTMSTEFAITRPCSIPADGAQHKVTIGIIMLSPHLVHESVPSKNASAFLTASAVNSSQLPLLSGPAAVYLDGAFVAKTTLKAVSPGEQFTASLGVDPAVPIEYKPAHKYREQLGVFSHWSSTITEQKIVVKNTRGDAVLLTIREQIPRSTDEKIRVRVLSPEKLEKVEEHPQETDEKPKVGAKMLPSNNVEWTVELEKGASQTLLVKYALEHPSGEHLHFYEQKWAMK